MLEELKSLIQQNWSTRDFEIYEHDGKLTIKGIVKTFYQKQIALNLIQKIVKDMPIEFKINVANV